MSVLYLPLICRIFNFLRIGGLILLLSCQSDPIILNPPGGYEYLKKSFHLSSKSFESIQGELHTGKSPRLYSGILTNGDTVSTLIQLLPQILDSHQVCRTDSIVDVRVVLASIAPIAMKEDTTFIDTFIQLNAVKAHLILSPQIDEDSIIKNSDLIFLDSELISEETSMSVDLKTNYNLEINLFDQNNTIIESLCNEQEKIGILVSYLPTDSSYLEFYSSNGGVVDIGPRLSVEYILEEDISRNYNCYSFNEVTWLDELVDNSGPYYVDDISSDYWGTFYAISLEQNDQVILIPPLNYNSISVQKNIISDVLNASTALFQIKVDLNTEIINEIIERDSITFSLKNAIAFISNIDVAGDNVGTNPDSTENNNTYDLGEKFYNYGLDNCPDTLEDGEGGCVNLEEESAYNTGTEGNKERDWTDKNGNGKWDTDEGEMWGDWGFDSCPDSLENGSGGCLVVPDITLGYDPNEDNTDPTGDDWHAITNPDSTEGNHKWDSGEPYNDWGSDGLPVSLVGDPDENGSEGNGSYDTGEPFEDTGTDGFINVDESGYNVERTEGNNKFDGEGEFIDCGEDNCCNADGASGICVEIGNDNYNIDPNNDNWSVEDSTGTEGNGQLDLINGSYDVLWSDGDGEQWFDWGLDQIPDSLEAFQTSLAITPNLYNNSYIFKISEEELQESPELVSDTVSLWISEIKKTGNSLAIQVSIQTNVILKGLQFQLFHTPFTKVETKLQPYEASIAQFETEKLFEDLTLFPREDYTTQLEEKILIDYANDISSFLDFESLNIFLSNEEHIFSHQYSNLVMYVDKTNTDIHNDGMWVHVSHENSTGQDDIIISKIVSSLSDSIEIPMEQIFRGYQNGSISIYDRLKLKSGGNLYNYSKLSIQYNLVQTNYNPRIDLMYTK